jgi:ABC-type glycerol-3-phosphate transport system substrate-binding protein
MQRRIRLASSLLGVGILLATAGCSSPAGTTQGENQADQEWSIPEKDPTATIKVLSHLQLEKNGMQGVLDAFNKEHPSIKVEFESVPFDQLNSVLEARVSAKDGNPDVYWADMPRLAALTARGYTTDLTKQFEPYTDSWDKASLEGSSVEGKLEGVPIANSTQLLFYNKDLLDKAGVAYPSDDAEKRVTWEKLSSDAKKAVDAGAPNGLVLGQVDRYYQLEALPVSLGGSPGATGDGNLTPDITSEAWVKSMGWYGSIFKDGLSPRGVGAEQSDPDFLAGKTAFQVQGPWLLPALQKSKVNWGVALHPYFENGKPVTASGSWALSMNPFSQKKEAAAIFMKWMSVDNGGGYAINAPTPELPANVDGKDEYFARSVFASEEGKKAAKIIDYETANTGITRLSTVGYVEFEEVMGRAFSDIRNGSDPKAALETAAGQLSKVWAPYK